MQHKEKDFKSRRKFLKSITGVAAGIISTSVLAKTSNSHVTANNHQSYDDTLHVNSTKPFVLYF